VLFIGTQFSILYTSNVCMLQVSLGQCQTIDTVSDSIINGQCQSQFSFFSFFLLLLSIASSYRYVSLSVSKLRSLERGGVSELSQAQVDR
jgi:hypothetical protein